MPIATHTRPSGSPAATRAFELTRLTAMLEHVARDVTSAARERRHIRDLGCAIRHLAGDASTQHAA